MTSDPGDRPRAGRGRRSDAGWAVAAAATVLVALLGLLLDDPRRYFYGDTAAAYYGWWYHLGDQLRAGNWPLLDPQAWRAGELAAEGQWGLYSPLVMLIGLLATVSGNVVLLATGVTLALVLVGSMGVFALVRSYGAPPVAAYIAAVAVPMGGMTQYLDVPSWKAGLMIWALLPWVWWALRRTMLRGANPLAALLLAYLLVSVGYVYGTIMLVCVLVACLLDCWALRDRAAALRLLGVGVFSGLVATAVYLPGMLTVDVTIRGLVGSGGKFTTDPVQTLTSVLPTASVHGTSGHLLPYAYAAWFLPVLLWVDVARLRRAWRPLSGLFFMTAVTLLLVNGPGELGPLRWPLRLQTFLVQMLVVLCVVLMSRCAVRRPSRSRLALSLGWVALAGVVAVVRTPQVSAGHVLSVVLVGAGIATLWVVIRSATARPRALAATVALFTVGLLAVQHGFYSDPPSPRRNLPTHLADYRSQLASARGDVLVVGDSAGLVESDAAASEDLLVGSAWYLNPHPVQNTYTTISFLAYHDRYCIYFSGNTCPELLDTLFTPEHVTGLDRVDLLAVSTLLLVRSDLAADRLFAPPAGWHVSDSSRWTVTWVRDGPVPAAGGPVWTSPGTAVSVESADDRTLRLRVDRVPADDGGHVVLSRLAWPGYSTDAAGFDTPVDGYLLDVDLTGSAPGDVVTVAFSPPGWGLEVACWWLAILVGLGWSLWLWSTNHTRGVRRKQLVSP